jgi:lipase
VRLHTYEWGHADAPPLVCLHGVTGHGERYLQLAEERWAKHYRVVAPDLRGHGHSGWDAPWTFETHVADLVETIDDLGLDQPDWVGHSFGGRLVLELAAVHPDRVRRAVLLDPAFDLLEHIAEMVASMEPDEPLFDSVAAYVEEHATPLADRARMAADLERYFDAQPDGRVRRRTSQDAVRSIFRELASPPPPPTALDAPALLVYAPAYGLVRDEHLDAYAERLEVVPVPGMHHVMWDAFDETADAVERFLENSRAER